MGRYRQIVRRKVRRRKAVLVGMRRRQQHRRRRLLGCLQNRAQLRVQRRHQPNEDGLQLRGAAAVQPADDRERPEVEQAHLHARRVPAVGQPVGPVQPAKPDFDRHAQLGHHRQLQKRHARFGDELHRNCAGKDVLRFAESARQQFVAVRAAAFAGAVYGAADEQRSRGLLRRGNVQSEELHRRLNAGRAGFGLRQCGHRHDHHQNAVAVAHQRSADGLFGTVHGRQREPGRVVDVLFAVYEWVQPILRQSQHQFLQPQRSLASAAAVRVGVANERTARFVGLRVAAPHRKLQLHVRRHCRNCAAFPHRLRGRKVHQKGQSHESGRVLPERRGVYSAVLLREQYGFQPRFAVPLSAHRPNVGRAALCELDFRVAFVGAVHSLPRFLH
jgi:hypothetical protein